MSNAPRPVDYPLSSCSGAAMPACNKVAVKTDYLLYDGECPACRAYVAIAALRKLHPSFEILDARHEPLLVQELRSQGYDINEGMVVSLSGTIHFGAEATRILARYGKGNGTLRRTLLSAIGDAPWSAWLYPKLNCGRQLLLKLLGRSLID